jgi:hypothetical protein
MRPFLSNRSEFVPWNGTVLKQHTGHEEEERSILLIIATKSLSYCRDNINRKMDATHTAKHAACREAII